MAHAGAWRTIERIAKGEVGALALLLLLTLLCLGFSALAGEMQEGETHAFDNAILMSMRNTADPGDPIGPYWMEEVAPDVTSLGSTAVLVVVALAVIGYLFLAGTPASSLLVVVSLAGGLVLSQALKDAFGRVRPDVVAHTEAVLRQSFPSGHATLSAVTYLTLGALLARVQETRLLKVYVLGFAVFLTLLVGVSRVYLGVHWPTDVLAGWSLGSAWAIVCWLVASRRQGPLRVR